MSVHSGSCPCGAVKFEIAGDFQGFFLCHCSRCRKVTGTAYASNLFSPDATLRWISGEDKIKIYNLPETRFGKAFCCDCGSALPRARAQGKGLMAPAGSLDTPVELPPNAHIFTASRADWDHDLETVPGFEGLPG